MWVDIKGWEGLYELNENGDVRNKITNKLIAGDKNSAGYLRVCLYKKGHTPPKQRFFRHRLVAEHFIHNPRNLPEVNHKDCNVKNNHISNLEWVSKAENEHHSHIIGSKPYKGYIVKHDSGAVNQFTSCGELAKILDVTNRTVVNWLHGDNQGFKKHGITEIVYRDSAKSLTTIESIGI